MDTLRAKFRCRMCGNTHYTCYGGADLAEREMRLLLAEQNPTFAQSPRLNSIHYCENGDLGLSDFLGWECIGENE